MAASNPEAVVEAFQVATAYKALIDVIQRLALGPDTPATSARFHREYGPALAHLRRAAGLTAVPGAPAGYFQVSLSDDTTGYLQRRTDDCLQAAIASCLQVAPHLVPDLRLNDAIDGGQDPELVESAASDRMKRWLDSNRLSLRRSHHLPHTGRWIAVEILGDATHCLLVQGRDILFDPAAKLASGGSAADTFDWGSVDYGITVE